MKLVLAEPRYLKDSVTILSELVNDVQMKINEDQIEIVAMDPANVAMIIFKMMSSAFVEYNIEGEKTISINLDNLKQVLRRSKSNDTVVLELDEDKNRLKVQFKGEGTRTFYLGLLDMDEKEQKIPDLSFTAKVDMGALAFDEAVGDMDIISDSVSFTGEDNELRVQAVGNVNEGSVVIGNDEETSIILDSESVKSRYSVEYLKKIIKGGKLSDKINLQFSQDYPLKIEYRVKDILQFTTILAPRVDVN
tara:strand:+ start:2019 stop:2765 length:747 start_codon:yes stop_codon:yes gene_type:complete